MGGSWSWSDELPSWEGDQCQTGENIVSKVSFDATLVHSFKATKGG